MVGKMCRRIRPGSGDLIWSKDGKEIEHYAGQLKNGKLNGIGTVTWVNGDKYEGDFVDNKRTGKGIYICSNGRQFSGNFENYKPVGFDIKCHYCPE